MDIKFIKIALLNLPGWGTVSARKLIASNDLERITDHESLLNLISSLAEKHKRIKIPAIEDIETAYVKAKEILQKCKEHNISVLSEQDHDFPKRLLSSSVLPPLILYVKGNKSVLNDNQIIALIGTRKPNNWVYQSMHRIGERFAKQNITVLSGLALGCDTAAHQGCLQNQGVAIAVLGNGLDEVYPKQNKSLANHILEQGGCLVSEYPPGNRASKYQLIARDKLQASLSDQVIVGQTSIDGGSMHAANFVIEKLHRPIAVLRGSICKGSEFSGNDDLICRGAKALINSTDLKNFSSQDKKQAILFDLDQTLIDSSLLETMRSERNWDKVLQNLDLINPAQGVDECLETIKDQGLMCGIVTNSPSHYVKEICNKFGWSVDIIVAYHDTNKHKPDPEPLLEALRKLDIKVEDCLYIGDHRNDEEAALNARMDYVYFSATEPSSCLNQCLTPYIG